jgi:diadenosine tetraphosphate (Ap4A) HIT family hydrolase
LSFHSDYEKWVKMTDLQYCPVCQDAPKSPEMVSLGLAHTWKNIQPVDCLKGACSVLAKKHAVELYDLNDAELLALMKEVQLCARALKNVTGAVKINYELYGNTVPHLHIHLYPRHVDDPFPGRAIDYTQKINQYNGQFEAFVERLSQELEALQSEIKPVVSLDA